MAEAAQVLAAALPGARFLPALRRGNVHGALDMGLAPGPAARAGRPSRPGATGSPQAWGSVPAGAGPRHRRHPAAAAGDRPTAPGPPLVLLGADPLRRLPRPPAGPSGPSTAPTSWWRWPPRPAPSPSAPTWCCRRPRPTSGRAPPPTSRAGSAGWARSWSPPGQAWPDWMIAAELAVHLGGDLGLDSVGRRLGRDRAAGPGLPGHHPGRARRAGGPADGVVAPLTASAGRPRAAGGPPRSIPIAVPGVESVERQGAPPRAGLAEPPTAGRRPSAGRGRTAGTGPAAATAPTRRPAAAVAARSSSTSPTCPPADSYSLRLVAVAHASTTTARRCSAVPALAGLVAAVAAAGQPPRPRRPRRGRRRIGPGPHGHRPRPGADGRCPTRSLPRRVVAADFNVPLGEGTAGRPHRLRRCRSSSCGWRRREPLPSVR